MQIMDGPICDMKSMSQVPYGWWMQLMDKVSKYMQGRFWEEVFARQHALLDISVPVPLESHSPQYSVQKKKTHDIVASLGYDEIMAPTMVLDGNGNIKLWYLPGAINHIHQESVEKLHKHGWRMDWVLFCKMADLMGSIDLSLAWQPPNFHPKVSKLLRLGEESNSAQQWVNQMSEVHALLSRMLAIIHPWMYSAGWEALIQFDMKAKQWKDADISSILPSWNAVYSSMSIMVNCTTPYHMDINGWEQ
ncbi:hypothetical protein EDC04DRAFT_2603358 [Pisolithus marmoratus]|nr:hypothetical protein EDC04DRAFT_2603358 [Pisolithus marmoratus]